MAAAPVLCLTWRDSAATPRKAGPLPSFLAPAVFPAGTRQADWVPLAARGGGARPKTTGLQPSRLQKHSRCVSPGHGCAVSASPASWIGDAAPVEVSGRRAAGLLLSLLLYHNPQPLCALLLLSAGRRARETQPTWPAPGLSRALVTSSVLPAACVSSSVERT